MVNKLILAITLFGISLPCQAYFIISMIAPGFTPAAAQPVTHWSHSYVSPIDAWIFTQVQISADYANDDGNYDLPTDTFLIPVTGELSITTNFINPPRADYWNAYFELTMYAGGIPISDMDTDNDYEFMHPAYGP